MQPGQRLFTAASWGLIITGVIHLIGQFAGRPTDPAAEQLFAAMDGYRLPLPLGMTPSILDIYRNLGLTMSVTLVGLGLQNLLVARRSPPAPLLLRSLAGSSTVIIGVLVGLEAYYRISPPLVLLTVVAGLFLLSWIRLPATA